MRHAITSGMSHHHPRDAAAGIFRLLHQPGFWLGVAMLVLVAALVVLALVHGSPSRPEGWESYMWMPY